MTDTSSPAPGAASHVRWKAVAVGALSSLPAAAIIARIGAWRGPDGVAHPTLFDDAMISMSYARTLADGGGLVWYSGAPAVEGITNLGWTLVMAAVHWMGLGPDEAVNVMKLLGLVAVWATAAIAVALSSEIDRRESLAAWLAALVVSLNLPLLFWSVQGMEVGALTFLTLSIWLLSWRAGDRERLRPATAVMVIAAVGAGIVIRTDFVTVPVAVLVWAAWSDRAMLRRIGPPILAAVVVALAATTAFRLIYYGVPVPNTYDLKVTGVPVTTRLWRGTLVTSLSVAAVVLPSLAIIAWEWRGLDPATRRRLGLPLAIVGAQVGYSVVVGGDAWESFLVANRYLTPAVVCATLAAVLRLFAPKVAGGTELKKGTASLLAIGAIIVPGLMATIHRMMGNRAIGSRLGLTTPSRDSIVAGVLIALGAGLLLAALTVVARRGRVKLTTSRVVPAALAISLLLGIASQATTLHRHTNGAGDFASLGAELRSVTTADALIAVGAAGATQYFSGRMMIDILGKNDRHIARLPATTPDFLPGHNKYDARWSLDRLRPDVVATGVVGGPDGPADGRGYSDAELRARGYRPYRLRHGEFHSDSFQGGTRVIYVRRGTDAVLFDQLLPVD